MTRLIVVSNRLPVRVKRVDGELKFPQSVGGLATGLESFYKSYDSIWIGWPGISSESLRKGEKGIIRTTLAEHHCRPVFLSRSHVKKYYHGFSNRTIWPVFSYFPQNAEYNETDWESYREVNKQFAKAIAEVAKPTDTIWIHDYHLILLPSLLRSLMPEAAIGFFLHIPFPTFEIFRLFPWRDTLLEGLLGADLIGFHTYDYARYFLESVHRIMGYEHIMGKILIGERIAKVDTFPMGIDYERYAHAVTDKSVDEERRRIRTEVGNRKIVLSVDRLDYTKGILPRLKAFDLFLDRFPQYKGQISLILLVVPSRTGVHEYQVLKKSLDQSVGRINGKHGSVDWIPIRYLYRSVAFPQLIALYSIADVALVTPLRDGMNLVAKEFLATKIDDKGVLVLSEMAGAATELGEAIIVNPNDETQMVNALETALTMPESEQKERNSILRERLQRYTVSRWASDFVDTLLRIKSEEDQSGARRLSPRIIRQILTRYRKSSQRLFLLDYDGTLVPFAGKPGRARPDHTLLRLLRELTGIPQNKVVIISGRDRHTLTQWFSDLDVALVAEHGAWIHHQQGEWRSLVPFQGEWKNTIRPILELYVDRTPGAFVEEKESSLVWHYRKTDENLALVRSSELEEILLHQTANLDLGVLKGNKIIEVRHAGINKGRAAQEWEPAHDWDFVLAMGDDDTDEELFAALPKDTYTIKVGGTSLNARFNVKSYKEARELLTTLTGTNL